MASTSSPYGLQPISDGVGTPRTLRIPYGITSGLASNIFKFTPVFINVTYGTVTPCTATTDKIFGVFAGVEYTPTGGRPTVSPLWASGTTYDSSLDMFVYIWPAWNVSTRWQIQADGAVAQPLLGSGFNLSNFTAGNTSTGLSGVTAAYAGVAVGGGSATAQVTLQEFAPQVNDAIGDAYTDLIVTITYPQIGFQGSFSIG